MHGWMIDLNNLLSCFRATSGHQVPKTALMHLVVLDHWFSCLACPTAHWPKNGQLGRARQLEQWSRTTKHVRAALLSKRKFYPRQGVTVRRNWVNRLKVKEETFQTSPVLTPPSPGVQEAPKDVGWTLWVWQVIMVYKICFFNWYFWFFKAFWGRTRPSRGGGHLLT